MRKKRDREVRVEGRGVRQWEKRGRDRVRRDGKSRMKEEREGDEGETD